MGLPTWATSKLLLYIIAGLLALNLAQGTAFFVQSKLLDAEKTKVTAVQTERDSARSESAEKSDQLRALARVNEANRGVADELARRLKEAVGQEQQTQSILAKAVAERDTARRARAAAETKLSQQRQVTYATDPTCREWGARPVCAAISDSVWQQWEAARSGADAGPDRGGSEAPAGAHRADADRGPAAGPGPGPGG